MTDQTGLQSDIISCHLLEAQEAQSPDRELKVLSVGCGDETMDNIIQGMYFTIVLYNNPLIHSQSWMTMHVISHT